MTKEQALKHGGVIGWWLNHLDKGVWWNGTGDWTINKSPEFSVLCDYVQNDEYAEYRKALADGKLIQVIDESGSWHSILGQCSFAHPRDMYRIEPEKPKFKVGDWVKDSLGKLCRITIATDEGIKYTNSEGHRSALSFGFIKLNKITKWKPVRAEWCVCWDDCENEYTVAQYNSDISHNAGRSKHNENYWDNIAPIEFLSTLKETNE